MDHFAGLDVSVKQTSICIVDDTDRIVVAGSRGIELMFELQRLGYVRAAATANCGHPAGQYDVALVDWRRRTFNALEPALDWLVGFLRPNGVLVVWVDP